MFLTAPTVNSVFCQTVCSSDTSEERGQNTNHHYHRKIFFAFFMMAEQNRIELIGPLHKTVSISLECRFLIEG